MSRNFARSLAGKKAYNLRRFYKGRKITLIGGISIEGVVATKTIEGSMKGEDFHEFIEKELMPHLREGPVIVMDNLRAHKMEKIEKLVASKGIRIEYLSPYSPEFNPIEMLWSALKAFVRKFASNSIKNLSQLIDLGLLLIEKEFFRNIFVKCCYCAS
jgi:transposase